MNNPQSKSGLMIGIGSVAEFLGVSEKQIYNFLRWGMPGGRLNGVWYFHKENVETWWRGITAVPGNKQLPAEEKVVATDGSQ